MPEKGSFQWNAVRFANKIFCVTHAIKSSAGYDYVIWLDADTYSFRPMPENFLEKLLPEDSLVTYLGREIKTRNVDLLVTILDTRKYKI